MVDYAAVGGELVANVKAKIEAMSATQKAFVLGGGAAIAGITASKLLRKKSKRKSKMGKSVKRGHHRRFPQNIKRGRGLGKKEIHHGHKGKKLVQFKDKKTGKLVRFYVKKK